MEIDGLSDSPLPPAVRYRLAQLLALAFVPVLVSVARYTSPPNQRIWREVGR